VAHLPSLEKTFQAHFSSSAAMESENPKRNSGDLQDASLQHHQPRRGERKAGTTALSYHSDSAGFESDAASEHGSQPRLHAQARSEASEGTSAASHKGVPGSARWLQERNDALEEERLALVKQTLEVQGLLDSVKLKVRTARDITAGLEISAGPGDPSWALESERMLGEKQELISRLIVQSQQAFFMAKVRQPGLSGKACCTCTAHHHRISDDVVQPRVLCRANRWSVRLRLGMWISSS